MKKYDRFGRSIKAHHDRHPETGITPDYRDPDLAFKNAIQSGVFHEIPDKKSYNFVGNWMCIQKFLNILTRNALLINSKTLKRENIFK
jgi:hypothetical protein